MKIIITEEQYNKVLMENTFKDVMSSLKLNSSIVFTFGAGVSAFMGPVERLLTKSNFSFNKQEIVLLIITSFALLINDSNKTKLLEEITDKGLIKAFKGVFEFIKNTTEIIKATIKNLLGVSYNLSEILGFVFLLNPIMKILESIITWSPLFSSISTSFSHWLLDVERDALLASNEFEDLLLHSIILTDIYM